LRLGTQNLTTYRHPTLYVVVKILTGTRYRTCILQLLNVYIVDIAIMVIMEIKTTTIEITTKLRDYLQGKGNKGQTYEDIIWELIKKKR